MIAYRVIPAFQKGIISVRKLIACDCGNASLLVCPECGTTLAVEKAWADALAEQVLSDDLAFLLVQRGMAAHPQSRPVSEQPEQINPTFFLIDLTKACNFACIYCFREPEGSAKRMSPEKLEQICDSLIAYARRYPERPLSIQAWGGEPLLEIASIAQLRSRFREGNLHPEIVIETNAALITPEIARTLFEHDIRVGISIDGIAAIHNLQRPTQTGLPSLALVERGIENLYRAGYQSFGTITVVTRHTLAHLQQVMDYFAHTLHLHSIKFNLMRKNDRNRDLAISLDEVDGYVRTLLRCLRQLYEEKYPIVEQNVAQRIANLLFRPNNNICNACGCHGGYRMLSIDSSGDVFPCELSDYPDYRLGNVSSGDFDDMVRNARGWNHEYFRERDLSPCGDCPWWYYCRGGCRSSVKYDTGSPLGIDQTECRLNRVLYPLLTQILLTDPGFAQYLLNGVV